MGGYAEFVWSSFGLTALIMVLNVVFARRRLRQSLEQVALRVAGRTRAAPPQQTNGEEVTRS